MNQKERKSERLNNRLLDRLMNILGPASFRELGFERARLIRMGKVMLVVARKVKCKDCGRPHRTMIHLASHQKSLKKLFKKK